MTTPRLRRACSVSLVAAPVDISFALLDYPDDQLRLVVDACTSGDVNVSVDETSSVVTVEVRAKVRRNADCGYEALAILNEPLGDRLLIDGFDGEMIPFGHIP